MHRWIKTTVSASAAATLALGTMVTATAQAAPTFAAATTVAADRAEGLGVGDFNADGRPDIAVGTDSSSSLTVLIKDATGSGYTALNPKPAVGVSPVSVAVGDLNADGRPDIVTANSQSNTVSVLLKDASGTGFTALKAFTVGRGPRSVAVGDLNADGRPDLAVANRDDNTVSVLLKDTTGTGYTPLTAIAVGTSPQSVAIGDLNGDGRPDLATANLGDDTVSVLLKDASGTGYTARTPALAVGSSPLAVTVGDLDGDSREDIAAANISSNTLSVLRQNATGTGFAALNPAPATGTSPVSVARGDLDGDGRPDLAAANANANTLSVLTANAARTGYVALNPALNVGTAPRTVAIADLNADGRPDLLSANRTDDTVSVLLNTSLRPTSTTVACTPDPVKVGASLRCTATGSDIGMGSASRPTGTVTFTPAGSCTLADASAANQASCTATVTPTAAGPASISGAYGGDATHASSSGSDDVTVTERATTPTLTCSPNPVTVGAGPTTCTATVTDTDTGIVSVPTGTVTLSTSRTGTLSATTCTLEPTSAPGQAACAVDDTPTQAGTDPHQITAAYAGDDAHAGATTTTQLSVLKPTPTPTDTGTTGTPAGPGGPAGLTKDTVAPQLGGLTLPRKAKRGKAVALRFTSTEAATLRVVLSRKVTGVRKGTKCVAGRARGKRKRCTTTASVKTLTSPIPAGAGILTLATKTLALGPLTLTLTATDAAGNASTPIVRKLTLTKK